MKLLLDKKVKEWERCNKMNSGGNPSHADRFHTNVVGLGELIYDVVKDVNSRGHFVVEPALVELTVRVLERLPSNSLIDTFIEKSNTSKNGSPLSIEEHCWTKIKVRDRSFFINNAGELFSGLPGDHIDAFRKMFQSFDSEGNTMVSSEDEDEIWLYFESFVKIAIKYIHGNRKPVMIRTGSEEMRKYQEESFFGDVDLLSHADKWGVVLEFS